MKNQHRIAKITQATEESVRLYFDTRGWNGKKLDKQSGQAIIAADWLFERENFRFLCEVKTITSVRKGIKPHNESEQKSKTKPHTESHFSHFTENIAVGLSSVMAQESLQVQIHSHYIYQPTKKEEDSFLTWLKDSLLQIKSQRTPREWSISRLSLNEYTFHAHYTFGSQSYAMKPSLSIQVTTGNKKGFKLETYIYGELHTTKIEENISKARKQLEKTALRQPKSNLPRVVILAFEGSNHGALDLDEESAITSIAQVLKNSPQLSAVGILHYSFAYKPRKTTNENWEEAINDTIKIVTSPVNIHFTVIHNRYRDKGIDELPFKVFEDDQSVQFSSL